MSPTFCSNLKQHESSWRKLALRTAASHVHDAASPSANSAAKQKSKQQFEEAERLKALARAPPARLRSDLRQQFYKNDFFYVRQKGHRTFPVTLWTHMSVQWLTTSLGRVPPTNKPTLLSFYVTPFLLHVFTTSTGTASPCRHFSQALSGPNSATPPATPPTRHCIFSALSVVKLSAAVSSLLQCSTDGHQRWSPQSILKALCQGCQNYWKSNYFEAKSILKML